MSTSSTVKGSTTPSAGGATTSMGMSNSTSNFGMGKKKAHWCGWHVFSEISIIAQKRQWSWSLTEGQVTNLIL